MEERKGADGDGVSEERCRQDDFGGKAPQEHPDRQRHGHDARGKEGGELPDVRLGKPARVQVERDHSDRHAVRRPEEKDGEVDEANVGIVDAA